jgi:hypothetical protein
MFSEEVEDRRMKVFPHEMSGTVFTKAPVVVFAPKAAQRATGSSN